MSIFEEPAAPQFEPSPLQAAIIDRVRQAQSQRIGIEAGAGCGKTTILIEVLRELWGNTYFGAYNKAIANEIKAKVEAAKLMRNDLRIGTLHAAGLSAVRRMWPRTIISDDKVHDIIKDWRTARDPEFGKIETFISRMVAFGRQNLIGVRHDPYDRKEWMRIVDHHYTDQDLPDSYQGDFEGLERALDMTIEVLNECRRTCPDVIDFEDMIYAPLAFNAQPFRQDWLLLDEIQDLNESRLELARRMLNTRGGFVGVGDNCQAIYGFTGAGADAMERVIKVFNCSRMPLNVTYRCPQSVVTYANTWMPNLRAHETAPLGVVRNVFTACLRCRDKDPLCPICKGKQPKWFMRERPRATDAILCRRTKPLIATAFAMIREGIPCKVEGRDVGKGLRTLALKWKTDDLDRLEELLVRFLRRELAKAKDAKSERRANETSDKVETLFVLMDRSREKGGHRIADLLNEIDDIFTDDVSGVVTLCTGHKAKGREWVHVFILDTPPINTQREWEEIQESNLKGVMATRAQWELVLVPQEVHEAATASNRKPFDLAEGDATEAGMIEGKAMPSLESLF